MTSCYNKGKRGERVPCFRCFHGRNGYSAGWAEVTSSCDCAHNCRRLGHLIIVALVASVSKIGSRTAFCDNLRWHAADLELFWSKISSFTRLIAAACFLHLLDSGACVCKS